MMNQVKTIASRFFSLVMVLLLCTSTGAINYSSADDAIPALSIAETEEILMRKFASGEYSRKGADQCLRCHDADSDVSAMGIFENSHGSAELHGGPFQGLQCEACHGPIGDHGRSRPRRGEAREPMITFGENALVQADKQNSVCLSCHDDSERTQWPHGAHQAAEIPCAACHKMHEKPQSLQLADVQKQVCGQCHVRVMSQLQQRSAHPVQNGALTCLDCHRVHGSGMDNDLPSATQNQLCETCHTEKRGPFLWEHQPVAEDCGNCHVAHGTLNANLLLQRTPQLCQSCHVASGHPAVPYGKADSGSGGGILDRFTLANSCTSCHAQVHGSNHPSGNRLQR